MTEVRESITRSLVEPDSEHGRLSRGFTGSHHIQTFWRTWGDVICFPIDWTCANPSVKSLNAVWMLRPIIADSFQWHMDVKSKVSEIEALHQSSSDRESFPNRLTSLNLNIPITMNLDFTDRTILASVDKNFVKSLKGQIQVMLKTVRRHSHPIFNQRNRPNELPTQLRAWDLVTEVGGEDNLTPKRRREIAEELFPSRAGNLQLFAHSFKRAKKLIQLFDRPIVGEASSDSCLEVFPEK